MMKATDFYKVLLLFLLLAAWNWNKEVIAQDIHFSQYFMSPLLQNPAMAGAENGLEGNITYRTQWKSVTVPYKTYGASVHGRFSKKNSKKNFFAAGLNVNYDEAGDGLLKTTTFNLSLAYHVRINKTHTLGLGFMSGFGQRKIDSGNFEWGSQYVGGSYNAGNPIGENMSNPNFSYLDFASGIVWSFNNQSGRIKVATNNFMRGSLGFSVYHFNKPDYSFNNTGEKLWLKYVAHGNLLLSLPGSKLAVNPGFLFYSQGPNRELMLGGMVRYELLPESKYTGIYKGAGAYLGAYVRAGDAIVISSMIELSGYAIGFSYDANLSNLRPATNGRGGFEISLRIIGNGSFSKSVNTR